MRKESGAVSRL